MKNIIFILLLFISAASYGQTTLVERPQQVGTNRTLVKVPGRMKVDSLLYLPFRDTFNVNVPSDEGGIVLRPDDNVIYRYDTTEQRWFPISGAGSEYDTTFDATRPSTSSIIGLSGVTLGTKSIKATLQELIYPAQPPTVSLTGGIAMEYMSAGSPVNQTVSYTVGRQTNTAPLSSVVVAGQSITNFDNDVTPPHSQSGTVNVSIPRNTNTTYSITATAEDGKVATATTSFTWLARRYYGFVYDTTGGFASGALDATIRGLSNELNNSRTKGSGGSWNSGSPGGNAIYVYAWISTAGAPSAIKMNGFDVLDTWKVISKTFTTSTGFTTTYYIAYTKSYQNTSSYIEVQ